MRRSSASAADGERAARRKRPNRSGAGRAPSARSGALRAPPRCPEVGVAADGLARERLERADDVADHPAVLAAQPLDEHRDEGLVPQREARFVAGRPHAPGGVLDEAREERRGRGARVGLGEAHERVGERDPRLDGLVGDERVHPRRRAWLRPRRRGRPPRRRGRGAPCAQGPPRARRRPRVPSEHAERAQHRAGGGTVARARRREQGRGARGVADALERARDRLEDRGVALLGRRGGERGGGGRTAADAERRRDPAADLGRRAVDERARDEPRTRGVVLRPLEEVDERRHRVVADVDERVREDAADDLGGGGAA